MERLNNLDLSECFKEGSPTHHKIKKQQEQTQSNERDVDDSKTLRVAALNDLNELVNKRIYQ